WRLCCDFRPVNKATRKDAYPLPRIDDILSLLAKASVFTVFDAFKGFWQVRVKKEDRYKTAFRCSWGLFQWICMPMGLTNSPATYQRLMDAVFAGYMWIF